MNICRKLFRSYLSRELQSAELGRDVKTSLCSEVDYRSETRIKFFWKLSALTNEKIKSKSWPDFINSHWTEWSLRRSVTSARTNFFTMPSMDWFRRHNHFSAYSLPAWIHVHLGSSCQQKILITASSEEEEFKFNQVFRDQILEKSYLQM